MKNLIAFAHALSDETRWRIIRLVMDEAMCVCELADILGMPQSTVSSHVQVIRKAGLLESEKCGKWAYFRVEAGYLELIATLAKTFSGSGGAVCRSDDTKATRRLKEREGNCCRGPRRLAGSRIQS